MWLENKRTEKLILSLYCVLISSGMMALKPMNYLKQQQTHYSRSCDVQ